MTSTHVMKTRSARMTTSVVTSHRGKISSASTRVMTRRSTKMAVADVLSGRRSLVTSRAVHVNSIGDIADELDSEDSGQAAKAQTVSCTRIQGQYDFRRRGHGLRRGRGRGRGRGRRKTTPAFSVAGISSTNSRNLMSGPSLSDRFSSNSKTPSTASVSSDVTSASLTMTSMPVVTRSDRTSSSSSRDQISSSSSRAPSTTSVSVDVPSMNFTQMSVPVVACDSDGTSSSSSRDQTSSSSLTLMDSCSSSSRTSSAASVSVDVTSLTRTNTPAETSDGESLNTSEMDYTDISSEDIDYDLEDEVPLPSGWRCDLSKQDHKWVSEALFRWSSDGCLLLEEQRLNRIWFNPPVPDMCLCKAPTPDLYFAHRLCLWMPKTLWKYSFRCPQEACKGSELVSAGLYHSVRRVVDLDSQYYLVGEYLQCSLCLGKVVSWSPSVLRQMDPAHRAQFPAVLTSHLACDVKVVKLMRHRSPKSSPGQLLRCLEEQHTERHLQQVGLYLQDFSSFCRTASFSAVSTASPCIPPPMDELPSCQRLQEVYFQDVFERLGENLAAATSVFGSILKLDSSKKIIQKLQSTNTCSVAWSTNVGNECDQVLASVLTGHEGRELIDMLQGLQLRYSKRGIAPPQLLYVDRDCCNGPMRRMLFPHWANTFVRLDIWRFVKRISAAVTTQAHPLYQTFMSHLSRAIFVWHEGDFKKLFEARKAQLQQEGFLRLSYSDVVKRISRKDLARHCRRTTRGIEETKNLIQELLETYSSEQGKDSLGVPLLDKERTWQMWHEQERHVSCIQDPPSISLYAQTGTVTMGGVCLPVYQCARGLMSLDQFHRYMNRFVPGDCGSSVLYQACWVEGVARWNQDRASAGQGGGVGQPSTCNTQLLQHLNTLSNEVFGVNWLHETSVDPTYTGEKMGLEYLLSQNGESLEDKVCHQDTDLTAEGEGGEVCGEGVGGDIRGEEGEVDDTIFPLSEEDGAECFFKEQNQLSTGGEKMGLEYLLNQNGESLEDKVCHQDTDLTAEGEGGGVCGEGKGGDIRGEEGEVDDTIFSLSKEDGAKCFFKEQNQLSTGEDLTPEGDGGGVSGEGVGVDIREEEGDVDDTIFPLSKEDGAECFFKEQNQLSSGEDLTVEGDGGEVSGEGVGIDIREGEVDDTIFPLSKEDGAECFFKEQNQLSSGEDLTVEGEGEGVGGDVSGEEEGGEMDDTIFPQSEEDGAECFFKEQNQLSTGEDLRTQGDGRGVSGEGVGVDIRGEEGEVDDTIFPQSEEDGAECFFKEQNQLSTGEDLTAEGDGGGLCGEGVGGDIRGEEGEEDHTVLSLSEEDDAECSFKEQSQLSTRVIVQTEDDVTAEGNDPMDSVMKDGSGYCYILALVQLLLSLRNKTSLTSSKAQEVIRLYQCLSDYDRHPLEKGIEQRQGKVPEGLKTHDQTASTVAAGQCLPSSDQSLVARLDGSRLLESLISYLCVLHLSPVTHNGRITQRWTLIHRDYAHIRSLLLNNCAVVENTCLQLPDCNETTLSDWRKKRGREQERMDPDPPNQSLDSSAKEPVAAAALLPPRIDVCDSDSEQIHRYIPVSDKGHDESCDRSTKTSGCNRSTETSGCNRSTETAGCKRSTETAGCNRSTETAGCNRSAETTGCNRSAETAGCNRSTKTAGCKRSTKTAGCNRSAETAGCNRSTKTAGCNRSTKTAGCNRSTKTAGCNRSTKTAGCKRSTETTGCDRSTETAGCNRSTETAGCNGSTETAGCNRSTETAGCNRSAETAGCNRSTKTAGCNRSTKTAGCNRSAETAGCNRSTKTAGCNRSTKTAGCNRSTKTAGCNRSTETTGCNGSTETAGCNRSTETAGCNRSTETAGCNGSTETAGCNGSTRTTRIDKSSPYTRCNKRSTRTTRIDKSSRCTTRCKSKSQCSASHDGSSPHAGNTAGTALSQQQTPGSSLIPFALLLPPTTKDGTSQPQTLAVLSPARPIQTAGLSSRLPSSAPSYRPTTRNFAAKSTRWYRTRQVTESQQGGSVGLNREHTAIRTSSDTSVPSQVGGKQAHMQVSCARRGRKADVPQRKEFLTTKRTRASVQGSSCSKNRKMDPVVVVTKLQPAT